MAKHPTSWSERAHYGQCGQNCPCCRFIIEPDSLGVCTVCASNVRDSDERDLAECANDVEGRVEERHQAPVSVLR
jgi:hypothetical protein